MRIHLSPTRELLQRHARLGRALGDPTVRRWRGRGPVAPSMPPLDFSEAADRFLVRVDLPGMQRDDIEVTVTGGRLEIAGEGGGGPAGDAHPLRVERFHGPFRRVVPLPRQADGDRVEASLEQGVLTIRIPKRGPDGGRRVGVR
jgi:HSP20 family protein